MMPGWAVIPALFCAATVVATTAAVVGKDRNGMARELAEVFGMLTALALWCLALAAFVAWTAS